MGCTKQEKEIARFKRNKKRTFPQHLDTYIHPYTVRSIKMSSIDCRKHRKDMGESGFKHLNQEPFFVVFVEKISSRSLIILSHAKSFVVYISNGIDVFTMGVEGRVRNISDCKRQRRF